MTGELHVTDLGVVVVVSDDTHTLLGITAEEAAAILSTDGEQRERLMDEIWSDEPERCEHGSSMPHVDDDFLTGNHLECSGPAARAAEDRPGNLLGTGYGDEPLGE